jgi:hypothetical protein
MRNDPVLQYNGQCHTVLHCAGLDLPCSCVSVGAAHCQLSAATPLTPFYWGVLIPHDTKSASAARSRFR